LIQVQGYSATAAGAAVLPFIVLMFVLSRWSGGLVDRYGARRPLIFGPIIAAIGFALYAIPSIGGSYWVAFFPGIIVLGFGMAIVVAPLTTTVMNSLPQTQAGIASGVNNAVSRLAGVLAIAIFGMVMLGSFNRQLDRHLKDAFLRPDIQGKLDGERIRLAAIEIPQEVDVRTRKQIKRSIDESFVAAFRLVMLLSAGLALGSAATAWLIIRDRSRMK